MGGAGPGVTPGHVRARKRLRVSAETTPEYWPGSGTASTRTTGWGRDVRNSVPTASQPPSSWVTALQKLNEFLKQSCSYGKDRFMPENTGSFKSQEEAKAIHRRRTIQRFSLQEAPQGLAAQALAACFVFSVAVSHPQEGNGQDHLL